MPDNAESQNLLGLRRNVWVMTITSFLTDVSSEMLFNLVPLFLSQVLGARTSLIGLIEGLAETTASLLKLGSGWLSDRLGKRKALAVAGYGLSTLAKPFLLLANAWGWVLGVRFADRVGKGIRTSPRDALLSESVDKNRRGLAFGLHRAGDTAGAVLGILIALLVVFQLQGQTTTLERGTFNTIVWLSAIPAVLAVLVLALGAREIPPATEGAKPNLGSAGSLSRRFKLFIGLVVIFTLGNSSDAFLVLRASDLGLSVAGVLGMLIIFNVTYTLISTPAGALSDRIGRRGLLIGGWIFYAFVYGGFALAGQRWQVAVLMGAYGVYYGLTEGVAKAFVADLVPSEKRGTAYGIYNAAVGVAAFPASLLAGLLWQGVGGWTGFGAWSPFAFGAVLALLAAAGMSLLIKTESQSA
jgi:MFS family permease